MAFVQRNGLWRGRGEEAGGLGGGGGVHGVCKGGWRTQINGEPVRGAWTSQGFLRALQMNFVRRNGLWRGGRGRPGPGLEEAAGWEREEGPRSMGRKKLQERVFVFLAVGTPFWCSCNFCPKQPILDPLPSPAALYQQITQRPPHTKAHPSVFICIYMYLYTGRHFFTCT